MSFVSNSGKFKLYTVLNGLIFPPPSQPRISFERAIFIKSVATLRIYECVLKNLVRQKKNSTFYLVIDGKNFRFFHQLSSFYFRHPTPSNGNYPIATSDVSRSTPTPDNRHTIIASNLTQLPHRKNLTA
jgi:hypothetical protein